MNATIELHNMRTKGMKKNSEIITREHLKVEWLVSEREKLENILIEQIRKPDLSNLKKSLEQKEEFAQMIQTFMESLRIIVKEELANQIFELGAFWEALEQCEKEQEELQKQQKSDADHFEEQTVYKDQILKILWEKEPVLHKELAEELQISSNNLSNVMRRMKNAAIPLIEENAVGKNKFYQLNREGRHYVLENMDSSDRTEELEEYAFQKKYKEKVKLEFQIDEEYTKFAEAFSMLKQEKRTEEFFVTFQYHAKKDDRYRELAEFPNIHIEMRNGTEQRKKRYQQYFYSTIKDYTRKEGLQSQGSDNEKNIGRDGLLYQEVRKKLEDYDAQMHSGRCRRSGL